MRADDEYLGSGKYLKRAVAKYGRDNFRKDIIAVFETAEEMFALEAKIVNSQFVSSKDTYNMKLGGSGGYDHIWRAGLTTSIEKLNSGRVYKIKNDPAYREFWKEHTRRTGKRAQELGVGIHAIPIDERKRLQKIAITKALEPESRAKRIESFKRIGHSQGQKNSQFGTCWLKNTLTGEVKKVKKELAADLILIGWVRGR
jgi:hypothetical protein